MAHAVTRGMGSRALVSRGMSGSGSAPIAIAATGPRSPLVSRGMGRRAVVTHGMLPAIPLPAIPPPIAGYRDRQILRMIRDCLSDTGEFHEVTTSGLPESRGQSAESVKLASLELGKWSEEVLSNEPNAVEIERTVHFTLTIHVRDADADARDDEADRLYTVAANAINGNSLGGITYTSLTFLSAGAYQPAAGIERRLKVAGQFVYSISDWKTRNTSS